MKMGSVKPEQSGTGSTPKAATFYKKKKQKKKKNTVRALSQRRTRDARPTDLVHAARKAHVGAVDDAHELLFAVLRAPAVARQLHRVAAPRHATHVHRIAAALDDNRADHGIRAANAQHGAGAVADRSAAVAAFVASCGSTEQRADDQATRSATRASFASAPVVT